MWKLSLILLFAISASLEAQEVITLTCTFGRTVYGEYACSLQGVEVLDPTSSVEITGEHLEGYTDSDVLFVRISSSNTPFMIQEVFTTFPNIYELEYYDSNLQSINIPDSARLEWLNLIRNNISTIESGMFSNQPLLFYLELYDCNVQTVDENAFEGLSRLAGLVLWDNQITELSVRTFAPLTALLVLDLEANFLTSIPQELLAENINLSTIYFSGNPIREVHPNFAANQRQRLRYLNMRSIDCVDRVFTIVDELDWMDVNNSLQTCFNNFDGTVPEVRQISLEFTGNLRVFDRFGNIIASI
ncbi:CLUMA_CG014163, isoform A [Clunio marinus]|uniref:CLUMA_CG014163, isoform A n=1 Tax=Clunio marinus TaxID=568069 RepID=A0A1J1IMJ6_9DIPT|nr:CLUMA_CG014163, isoform A [Clunio marinus]